MIFSSAFCTKKPQPSWLQVICNTRPIVKLKWQESDKN